MVIEWGYRKKERREQGMNTYRVTVRLVDDKDSTRFQFVKADSVEAAAFKAGQQTESVDWILLAITLIPSL